MLRLYGSAKSRGLRTLWMLGELGIPYEHKDYLPRSPETKTPEFIALNANSRVPVIDDDGFVLSESMAINFYLAKKHNSPLYPTDPHNEALALQWSLWETDRLDRQIVNYVNHTSALPEADRKADIAEAAWKECVPAFDVLEAALKKSECRRCAVPRADGGFEQMAAHQDLAQSLLAASRGEASPRHARVALRPPRA
jgi:glutathione S-transferase